MKTPKSVVDHTAAYMDKGIKAPKSGQPKGTDFAESQTKASPMAGLGMSQHKRTMSKTGDRFQSPHEHLNPTAAVFHKIGRGGH